MVLVEIPFSVFSKTGKARTSVIKATLDPIAFPKGDACMLSDHQKKRAVPSSPGCQGARNA